VREKARKNFVKVLIPLAVVSW